MAGGSAGESQQGKQLFCPFYKEDTFQCSISSSERVPKQRTGWVSPLPHLKGAVILSLPSKCGGEDSAVLSATSYSLTWLPGTLGFCEPQECSPATPCPGLHSLCQHHLCLVLRTTLFQGAYYILWGVH